MMEAFKYQDKNFNLTTVNKQRSFYYRITKPKDIWGNFHADISFYDKNNNIIYHRKDCFAHFLKSDNFLGFVKWSKTGDIAFFYEFRPGPVPGDGIYHFLILLLEEKVIYRLDTYKHEYSYFEKLQDCEFENAQIMEQLLALGITGEECYTDKIVIHPIKWLTGIERWKPSNNL